MLKMDEKMLAEKLRQVIPGMGEAGALARARELIRDTDARLEENLVQWIQDRPIEDLWVGKYCINAVLSIRGSADFLSALEAMNLYLQDPVRGERLIWRARR